MIDLKDYGFPEELAAETEGLLPARVTAVHKERYGLICAHGPAFGRLKTAEYYGGGEAFPTTGDFVCIDGFGGGDCRIVRTLPRRSYFSRLDPSSSGHGEQAVAANFDVVFILQSLDRDFNLRRLERYLTLGWQSGATPVVVLTKADLAGDCADRVRMAERTAAGVGVFAVSARTGAGLDGLARVLRPGGTVVLLGSSGVGKSSLVNALAGREVMEVGGVREDDGRGRHTTTHRQLIRLDSGVMVIDTPGMRELGMWDVTEGLGQSFADVERYFGRCRFSDCRHQSEPGCAVRAAIEAGELAPERWESYRRLKAEARYSDDRAGYLREKQQWHKQLAVRNRRAKKHGGSGK